MKSRLRHHEQFAWVGRAARDRDAFTGCCRLDFAAWIAVLLVFLPLAGYYAAPFLLISRHVHLAPPFLAGGSRRDRGTHMAGACPP